MAVGHAQTSVIPQIADGGAWQTTLVLTNTTASATSVSLSFFQETGGGATESWDLPLLEVESTQNLPLPAAGTLFLHTPGTAGVTSVGWAQVQASAGVVAYAIFTQRVPGRQNQDGTAPAAAGATGILVPIDNTDGFVTSIAVANPTSSSESISVGLQPSSGASSQLSSIMLPAQGHMAFSVPQQFSASIGQKGLLELYSASGSLSALALRFNPTGAFTAAPVYPESSPIIVSGGPSGGGGTLPQFSSIIYTATFSASAETCAGGGGGIAALSTPGTYTIATAGCLSPVAGPVAEFGAAFGNVALNGETFTLTGLIIGSDSVMYDRSGIPYAITSGSMTITLSPNGAPSVGSVSGIFTLTSSLATLTGTLSGGYTAQ
jgi:hypothetical protein